MIVPAFFMSPPLRIPVNVSAAFLNWSCGTPVMRSTISGVYREYCFLSNWKTHRGCCNDRSYATFGGSVGGGAGGAGAPALGAPAGGVGIGFAAAPGVGVGAAGPPGFWAAPAGEATACWV